jgi:glycosyltransferase involved in cell wall biosynthesis
VLAEEGITHVHAPWGGVNAFIAMVAARLLGLRFSLQLRAHDIHRRTSAFLLTEQMQNADFVLTNTVYNRDLLVAMLPAEQQSKVRQVFEGLPRRSFAATALVKTNGPARILCVARLIEPKGLIYLLEACADLRSRGYAFECEIVGGPERPLYVNDYLDIRATYARLALDEHVTLAGALPYADVHRRYTAADLFVLPCCRGRDGSSDIIPNALLEAMAAGLPIVSTRFTAIPELVEDGQTGLLVEPRDARGLADAMACLLDDPGLRARLGRHGRARAEQLFDIERNIATHVRMFDSR